MALVVTSLASACGLNDRFVKLTAFTNPSQGAISAPTILVVDGEAMLVTDTSNSPTLAVARGHASPVPGQPTVVCSAHANLAPVVYGLTSDFTQTVSTNGVAACPVVSYGASGAITVPVVNQTIYLTKATAAAMTLAGPASDQTNVVTVVSLTAAAHTITYTAGFYQNTTSSDIVTFPSTSGACWTFQAKNGVWNATLGGGTTGGVTGPA